MQARSHQSELRRYGAASRPGAGEPGRLSHARAASREAASSTAARAGPARARRRQQQQHCRDESPTDGARRPCSAGSGPNPPSRRGPLPASVRTAVPRAETQGQATVPSAAASSALAHSRLNGAPRACGPRGALRKSWLRAALLRERRSGARAQHRRANTERGAHLPSPRDGPGQSGVTATPPSRGPVRPGPAPRQGARRTTGSARARPGAARDAPFPPTGRSTQRRPRARSGSAARPESPAARSQPERSHHPRACGGRGTSARGWAPSAVRRRARSHAERTSPRLPRSLRPRSSSGSEAHTPRGEPVWTGRGPRGEGRAPWLLCASEALPSCGLPLRQARSSSPQSSGLSRLQASWARGSRPPERRPVRQRRFPRPACSLGRPAS